jgi:hypothetical protein
MKCRLRGEAEGRACFLSSASAASNAISIFPGHQAPASPRRVDVALTLAQCRIASRDSETLAKSGALE